MSNITSVTREECEMLLNFGWSWNDERIDRLIRAHITLRDSTEQTIAGMQLKLKQAVENTTDYMEAGMRAGFIFGVSKDKGATVDNDPKMACELMAIERDELRDDIEQTIKAADALAEALGPFAKTWDEFEFEGLDGLISAKDRISGELDCSLDIQIKHWRTAVAEGYCQAERTRNEPDISFPLNREVIRRVRDYSTEELIEALREAAVHILAEHNCLGVALTLAHCVNVIEEKLAPVPVEAGAVVSR